MMLNFRLLKNHLMKTKILELKLLIVRFITYTLALLFRKLNNGDNCVQFKYKNINVKVYICK